MAKFETVTKGNNMRYGLNKGKARTAIVQKKSAPSKVCGF